MNGESLIDNNAEKNFEMSVAGSYFTWVLNRKNFSFSFYLFAKTQSFCHGPSNSHSAPETFKRIFFLVLIFFVLADWCGVVWHVIH